MQVDTGMNRLGLSLHEALELARRPDLMARVAPKLLMSHLACADEPEHPMNRAQLALFKELRAEFPGLPASLANSAGIHLGADYHFDLVRPGIALYGAEFAKERPPLATVVTAKARILQVREASAGEAVGYGATKHLEDDTRIAILSAGYADGYHRLAGSSDDAARRLRLRARPPRAASRTRLDGPDRGRRDRHRRRHGGRLGGAFRTVVPIDDGRQRRGHDRLRVPDAA